MALRAVCLYMSVLMEGISFGESPRWHDGRLWFSDWGAHQVIALDHEGGHEVVVSVPSFPMCIDFLPDGRLLVVDSAQRRLHRREPDGSMVTHAVTTALRMALWRRDHRQRHVSSNDRVGEMRAEQSYFRVGELLLLTPTEINTLVGGPIDISSVCMTGAEFDGSTPPRTRGVRGSPIERSPASNLGSSRLRAPASGPL